MIALLVVATAVFADAPTLSVQLASGPAATQQQALPAERLAWMRRLRATFRRALHALGLRVAGELRRPSRHRPVTRTKAPRLGAVLPFTLLRLPPPAALA